MLGDNHRTSSWSSIEKRCHLEAWTAEEKYGLEVPNGILLKMGKFIRHAACTTRMSRMDRYGIPQWNEWGGEGGKMFCLCLPLHLNVKAGLHDS